MNLSDAYSKKSFENIQKYFWKHVDLMKRQYELLNRDQFEVEKWISQCVVKGTPRNELNEYQIICQCEGDKMVFSFFPFIIGGEALEEIMELLSNQTLDMFSDFKKRLLHTPSEDIPVTPDYPMMIF